MSSDTIPASVATEALPQPMPLRLVDGNLITVTPRRLNLTQIYKAAKLLGEGDSLGFLALGSGLDPAQVDSLSDDSAAELNARLISLTLPRLAKLASSDGNLMATVYPYRERVQKIVFSATATPPTSTPNATDVVQPG